MASCLLVVDVQKGFINDNSKHIPALIEKVQNDYDYLIATQFHNPDVSEKVRTRCNAGFDANHTDLFEKLH